MYADRMNLREAAQEHAYGLTTEPQRLLNKMLQDFDPYLSLRRIPEGDPAFLAGRAFDPPRTFGVWEETSAASTKWVFTIPEISIQNPGGVLARVAAGDMSKLSPAQKIQLLRDANQAAELGRQKANEEKMAERREQALFIASSRKSRLRHTLNGEEVVIDSHGIHPARNHV
jgi:hypothetical protein